MMTCARVNSCHEHDHKRTRSRFAGSLLFDARERRVHCGAEFGVSCCFPWVRSVVVGSGGRRWPLSRRVCLDRISFLPVRWRHTRPGGRQRRDHNGQRARGARLGPWLLVARGRCARAPYPGARGGRVYATARPGNGGHSPRRSSIAMAISASVSRWPCATRISSLSLVFVPSTIAFDKPVRRVAWMSGGAGGPRSQACQWPRQRPEVPQAVGCPTVPSAGRFGTSLSRSRAAQAAGARQPGCGSRDSVRRTTTPTSVCSRMLRPYARA